MAVERHIFAVETEGPSLELPSAGDQAGIGVAGSAALALEKRLTFSKFRFRLRMAIACAYISFGRSDCHILCRRPGWLYHAGPLLRRPKPPKRDAATGRGRRNKHGFTADAHRRDTNFVGANAVRNADECGLGVGMGHDFVGCSGQRSLL